MLDDIYFYKDNWQMKGGINHLEIGLCEEEEERRGLYNI